MLKLYKFELDYGRMGDLSGIFVADDKDIVESRGKCVNFGEALGKHSEVYIEDFSPETCLTELTSDIEFINKFLDFECEVGYNPLEYIDYEEV